MQPTPPLPPRPSRQSKQTKNVTPPTPQKKKPKKAAKDDAPKKAYKKTHEESKWQMMAEDKEHFKPREPKKKTPIDPKVQEFFMGMTERNKKKLRLSDYDRSITKSYEKKKLRRSDVPQLGDQQEQSIPPLLVLLDEQRGLIQLCREIGLTL